MSAPSAPRGAPFCQVNPISNELMTKTGMSLRRGQPQSPSVLHWLVHTYYQVCLTFLRQCRGVSLWHLGFSLGFGFFQWLIYISDGAATAAALALTLLSSGLFFGFAPNFVGCLLLERHSVDSDESLRWRVCPALEFCTACVEDVCSYFCLCLVLAGIAGNWLQWRWLEHGPLCPFRVGHENCFYGPWKQFWSLVCAQRTIVFA